MVLLTNLAPSREFSSYLSLGGTFNYLCLNGKVAAKISNAYSHLI